MWLVYLKELTELLRDKKTLFFIIALPLLIFPVIFGAMGLVVANVALEEQQKVLKYAITNDSQVPEFSEALFYHRDFEQVELALSDDESKRNAVMSGQVDVVIDIPSIHSEHIDKSTQVEWRLFYNDASQLNSVKQKIEKVFAPYISQVQGELRTVHQLDETLFSFLTEPVKLVVENTANEREDIGEKVGGLLPYLLIVLCMTGAMYPAIDLGAGEKERGTLETLLLTPISRFAIVLGKFFTIMTTGVVTALITVASLLLWGYLIGEVAGVNVVSKVFSTVGVSDLLLILLMLVPVSAIFAAILLAISIYARSFKEAQNYMGPISLVGFLPVMVAMLPGIKLNWTWALVPISNVALAIKEIVKGTVNYNMLAVILLSTVVFAVISIIFCTRWFNKESVLFR
ncbi:ABC transporter permease [Thalassotalea fusca]